MTSIAMSFYEVCSARNQSVSTLQASSPIKKKSGWLPHSDHATIVQVGISYPASQFYNKQIPGLDKIFSPPIAYIAPANTMKDSQQGVSWSVPD